MTMRFGIETIQLSELLPQGANPDADARQRWVDSAMRLWSGS